MNTMFDEWSYIVILSAAGIYVGAFLAFAFDMAARASSGKAEKTRAGSIAVSLTWLGLVLHALGVLLRGISIGVVPWANMYEFTITATLMIVAVFQFASLRINLSYLGVFVTGFVVLALALATVLFRRPGTTLAVALDSYWLLIHVMVAMLATAFFALGSGLAGMQLLKSWNERRAARNAEGVDAGSGVVGSGEGAGVVAAAVVAESVAVGQAAGYGDSGYAAQARGGIATADEGAMHSERGATDAGAGGVGGTDADDDADEARKSRLARFLASLPNVDDLEQLSYRVNIIGFVFWTFTLIFGALWAQKAWGPLLGLGRQRGVDVHHLDHLRWLSARTGDPRVAWRPSGLAGDRRIPGRSVQLHDREHLFQGMARVLGAVTRKICARKRDYCAYAL